MSSQLPSGSASGSTPSRKTQTSGPKVRKSVSSRIHEAVKAIALCHNVTPVYESHASVNRETESAEADQDFSDENRTYQASSPDEVSSDIREGLCNTAHLLAMIIPSWCILTALSQVRGACVRVRFDSFGSEQLRWSIFNFLLVQWRWTWWCWSSGLLHPFIQLWLFVLHVSRSLAAASDVATLLLVAIV